jgi:hypothetical protein
MSQLPLPPPTRCWPSCLPARLQVGTDIEPLAVKATRANAELNGVAERLTAYQCAADLGQEEPLAAAGVHLGQRLFEVTVANILQVGWVGLSHCSAVLSVCCVLCAVSYSAVPWPSTGMRAATQHGGCRLSMQ